VPADVAGVEDDPADSWLVKEVRALDLEPPPRAVAMLPAQLDRPRSAALLEQLSVEDPGARASPSWARAQPRVPTSRSGSYPSTVWTAGLACRTAPSGSTTRITSAACCTRARNRSSLAWSPCSSPASRR
jgi:hypothetical protein